MSRSLERRGPDNRQTACSAAGALGESMWRIRAGNASLHFDYAALAKLIARRWTQDRRSFAVKMAARGE